MGRKSINRGVSAPRTNRIQFDFEFEGVRCRPTLERTPTEGNLRRARLQLQCIKGRIAHGTFSFAEEFPEYRFRQRVAKHDLAFASADSYRKILDNIWRSKIGTRLFSDVRYSELMKIADAHARSNKTDNNIGALR